MTSMTDATDAISDIALRGKTRLYPAKCAKQGSLSKWINAMRVQALGKGCDAMIPPMHASTSGKPWTPAIPTKEDELNAYLKKQRRLAELIYDWTDPNVDWDEFDGLDPASDTIGTDMWNVVMRIYNGVGPKAIQELRKQFNEPQAEDESCLEYWQRLKKAAHGLKQVDREPSSKDIIDAFKGGVSADHSMWTADIDENTDPDDLDELVRHKGEYVDSQNTKPTVDKKVAFAAQAETQSQLQELQKTVKELTVALAATASQNKPKRQETRTCFNCGKRGHIASDCRSRRDNRGAGRNNRRNRADQEEEETSAFPAFAFVAAAPPIPTCGTMYDVLMTDVEDAADCDSDACDMQIDDAIEPVATESASSPAPGVRDLPDHVPLCPWTDENITLFEPPVDAGPRHFEWDWIRAEFVDPSEFSEILRWKWDPIRRIRYRSIHPVGDEAPALNDPSHDLVIPVEIPEELPRGPPCSLDKSDKSDSRENEDHKSESCEANAPCENKPDKSEYRENDMVCDFDCDTLADTADSGSHDAGPSGTAAYHPGIPSFDDSSDESEDDDDPHTVTPSWLPADQAGGRRIARHPHRRVLSLATNVLRTHHRASRPSRSRSRSHHAVNTAMNLMYSFELAANTAETLYSDEDSDQQPVPRPVAAPASMGYDCFGRRSAKAWIVDSGANRHISAIASDFLSLNFSDGGTISGISVPIKGSGTVAIHVLDNTGTPRKLVMHDVLYAPELSHRSGHAFHRIFSVRQANELGCSVTFRPKNDLLVSGNGHEYFLIRRDGLTWLPVADPDRLDDPCHRTPPMPTDDNDTDDAGTTATPAHAPSAAILHRRCCHLNEADIQKLIRMGCLGKPRLIGSTFCRSCAMAKSRVANINHQSTRESDPPSPFHTVAMDIWGPMSTPAIGGFRYVIGLTDFKTNCMLAELVHRKSSAPDVLLTFLQYIRSVGHKVHTLRIDNDTVFLSETFQNICRNENITIQRTAPYAHHQLGRQERQWRTLTESVKAMLLEAGLDKRFWGYAFLTAVYVRNRVWSSGSQCIPMEAVTGTRPSLDNLRVFGSPAYVNIDNSLRRKLSDSAWEGIFVGYAPDSPAWLIYNPKTRNVVRSRSVTFNENAGLVGEMATADSDYYMDKTVNSENNDDDTPTPGEQEVPSTRGEPEAPPAPSPAVTRSATVRRNDELRAKTYLEAVEGAMNGDWENYNRLEQLKQIHGDDAYVHLHDTDTSDTFAAAALVPEPGSYRKAMMSPDKHEWKAAIDKEYNSQIKNNTWTLVPLPAGRRAIGCLWRFKVKRDQDGQIVKYKARLCARGDHQEAGIDYTESFSPTVRYQTLRTLLALACHYDLEIQQFDVVCAFLNADVPESIYMDQPEGFEQAAPGGGRLVCKLNRALYGLVQAPRCWNKKVTDWLEDYGFKQSQVDPGIYIMYVNDKIYILALYVDDAICVGRSLEFINKFKADFAEAFDIEDLGPVSWLLGCSIRRDRQARTLCVSQKQYIIDILETFGMSDCNPVATPMSAKPTIDDKLDEPLDTKVYKFAKLVGKLMYLANCTRPDIAAAVSHLSRYMSKPTCRHWEQGKRVLRYLKGTLDYSINYCSSSSPLPTAWQDASYGDGPNMRSRTGFLVTMCGAAVLWGSRLQPSVALSTVEAEYMALAAAAQEVCFLRQLLKNLGMEINKATAMMEDNKGCVALASNAMTTNKTKHINIRFHFVRDLVKDGTVELTWCPTENMLADILTKFSLPAARHKKLAMLMLNVGNEK